jgi:hypothetical protein
MIEIQNLEIKEIRIINLISGSDKKVFRNWGVVRGARDVTKLKTDNSFV